MGCCMTTAQILLILVITLQLADILSTYLVISKGVGQEANPVLIPLFKALGALPALLLVKGAVIAALLYLRADLPVELLGLIAAGYAWVVWHNFGILKGK